MTGSTYIATVARDVSFMGLHIAVTDMTAALTSAGYRGHLAPIDALWGARYCEVDDADGHTVGFHSPRT